MLNPDQQLALAYVPLARRPAIEALWALDAALGDVLRSGRNPMVSQIKLAWWREALERLDREPAPPEPVLEAVALHLLPAISGRELAELEGGWAVLLEPELGDEDLDRYGALRGGALFARSARLLGEALEGVDQAGAAWALTDLARHTSNASEANRALAAATKHFAATPPRWPVRLRPLGMLAVLAARDAARPGRLERPGAPARALRMLRHRLTGR